VFLGTGGQPRLRLVGEGERSETSDGERGRTTHGYGERGGEVDDELVAMGASSRRQQ